MDDANQPPSSLTHGPGVAPPRASLSRRLGVDSMASIHTYNLRTRPVEELEVTGTAMRYLRDRSLMRLESPTSVKTESEIQCWNMRIVVTDNQT